MSTPETDQALAEILERDGELSEDNVPAVLVKLCRKLERERDEARDTKWAREIHSCHNACARPMCVLRRERDEWKEKAERMQSAWNKWSEFELLLTHCQNCKEFRGNGHECKSEQDTTNTNA